MSESSLEALDIFQEPQGFYAEDKPATLFDHSLRDGRLLKLRLVGQNPLWGHYLWNAGKVISNYIEDHAEQLVKGKTVLELGAGAGLPSITASLHGATTVVATDYPDGDLIENLQINVTARHTVLPKGDMHAAGHLWGADPSELFSYLPPQDSSKVFDVLILADLLFNHSEHAKLLQTLSRTLKRTSEARALVFFTPYRPWLLDKDLAFFDLAAKAGFVVTKILESVMEKVMFEEDPGDELLRRTVFGYDLRWSREQYGP